MNETVQALERVYGPFESGDGYTPADLDAAEHRLGVVFPAALRVMYERTGRHSLHSVHNTLLSPGSIFIENRHLILYEESDSVCYWGISLDLMSESDPPVATSFMDHGRVEFMVEFSSTSNFLAFQAAWQAAEGALPFVGSLVVLAESPGAASVRRNIAPAGELLASTSSAEVRFCEGAIWYCQTDGNAGLAARDAMTFSNVSKAIGLAIEDWSYATLRDEE